MNTEGEPREFRPLKPDRRNELSGWGLTALCAGAWYVLNRQGSSLVGFMVMFFLLFFFTAIFTSLANWMETQTRLRLAPEGVFFQNGLRKVALSWEEIREIHVLPARWGRSVHVLGPAAHFHYRIVSELTMLGRKTERMGFPAGLKILGELVRRAGLEPVERALPGKYYARQST